MLDHTKRFEMESHASLFLHSGTQITAPNVIKIAPVSE